MELEDALSELDWETGTDDCGNIIEICFSGEKLHDEDEWLDAIAPHVDKGSQLMMRGEDGCSWCWYFDGESCTTYLGEVVFPDMPDEGKEPIYTHDEAALIVEEFETVLEKYGVKIPSPEDDEREKPSSAKRRERSTNGSGRLDCCARKWLEWKLHLESTMPAAPSCAALQSET